MIITRCFLSREYQVLGRVIASMQKELQDVNNSTINRLYFLYIEPSIAHLLGRSSYCALLEHRLSLYRSSQTALLQNAQKKRNIIGAIACVTLGAYFVSNHRDRLFSQLPSSGHSIKKEGPRTQNDRAPVPLRRVDHDPSKNDNGFNASNPTIVANKPSSPIILSTCNGWALIGNCFDPTNYSLNTNFLGFSTDALLPPQPRPYTSQPGSSNQDFIASLNLNILAQQIDTLASGISRINTSRQELIALQVKAKEPCGWFCIRPYREIYHLNEFLKGEQKDLLRNISSLLSFYQRAVRLLPPESKPSVLSSEQAVLLQRHYLPYYSLGQNATFNAIFDDLTTTLNKALSVYNSRTTPTQVAPT